MSLYQDKYRIESTRLRGWDYRSRGWYFVTICAQRHGRVLVRSKMVRCACQPLGESRNWSCKRSPAITTTSTLMSTSSCRIMSMPSS